MSAPLVVPLARPFSSPSVGGQSQSRMRVRLYGLSPEKAEREEQSGTRPPGRTKHPRTPVRIGNAAREIVRRRVGHREQGPETADRQDLPETPRGLPRRFAGREHGDTRGSGQESVSSNLIGPFVRILTHSYLTEAKV